MRRSLLLAAAATALLGAGTMAVLTVACSSEPDTHWGTPGNLNKNNLPGEAGVEPLVCGADDGGDAGGGGGGGGGGGAGDCGVSWKNDIYARMIGNDGWQCATSSCHAPGQQAPAIDPKSADAALASLEGYKMTQSRQNLSYIDTSGDPSKSSIECNLGGACNPAMPIGQGKPLTPAERCALHAWLSCGAPNN